MLSTSKGLGTAPEEGQAGELGDSSARLSPPSTHSSKAGTTTPRTCFPGTEIGWEGGVRGLGLPHAAFPWAFWVRIIMRLLITSYLCIRLKDLSLDVFTACTPMISFDFRVNSVHLWGRHPHLIDEGTEAWGGDCHVVISHTANKGLGRNQNPDLLESSLQFQCPIGMGFQKRQVFSWAILKSLLRYVWMQYKVLEGL